MSSKESGAEPALKPRQTRWEAGIPTDTAFLNPKIHLLFFNIKKKKRFAFICQKKRNPPPIGSLLKYSNNQEWTSPKPGAYSSIQVPHGQQR